MIDVFLMHIPRVQNQRWASLDLVREMNMTGCDRIKQEKVRWSQYMGVDRDSSVRVIHDDITFLVTIIGGAVPKT